MKKKTFVFIILVLVILAAATLIYLFVFDKIKIPENELSAICQMVSSADQRNYCLAVVNSDDRFCREIDEKEERNICLAMANKDFYFCQQIKEPESRKVCYLELILLTKDSEYCEELEDKDYCYFSLVSRLYLRSQSDEIKAEYCNKLPKAEIADRDTCFALKEKNSALCNGRPFCLTFFEQDLSFCKDVNEDISEGFKFERESECIRDRALTSKDPSICEKISDSYWRDDCYSDYAAHIEPNISFCDKITDEKLRNMCYVEVAIGLSENFAVIEESKEETEEKAEEPKKESEEGPKEEEPKEEPSIPVAYHIENVPYYGEKGWCWGSSALMLLMDQGFTEEETQEARTLIKTEGHGGPPDLFIAFEEYGLLDSVRIAYSKNCVKEYADFYNTNLLARPEEQTILFDNGEEALLYLKQLISSDVLVIIVVHYGNHFVIATGYDEDYIYTNDPGWDNGYTYKIDGDLDLEQRRIPMEGFLDEWSISGQEEEIGGHIGFPGDYGMIWLAE